MSAAKAWFAAAELAGLPGVPATPKGTRERAERDAWQFRDVQGKGGRGGLRREYAFASLPAEARAALQARALETALTVVTPAASSPAVSTGAGVPSLPPVPVLSPAELTDRQRLERDARHGVLAAIRRLQADAGCSQETALTTLLTNARAGRLDEHLDRMLRLARDPRGRAGDGYPSVRTLKRWLAAPDLAPKVVRPDMAVPGWAKDFLACYQRPEKPTVEMAYGHFCAQWAAGERPSIHQVRRFLAKLGAVTRERGRMGDRELKNIRPFVRRDFSLLEPNDVWSADGHTFDAEVQHPLHGRPFRPEITAFVDIATRRAVGWSVDLAESATAVADALRYGVERFGIPALIYVDNGSGYRNATMNDAATGLIGRIGATMTHSLPYNSQARGVIERLHQTLWVDGAKELPGFIGREMDREARLAQFKLSRKALKAGGAMPLLPWHLFVQWVEARISWYNARAHRSLKGLSPDLAWANFEAKGWQAERLTADELPTLFRPRVSRTLARAELRLFNNIYFAGELEEFHGAQVHVAYDIHDASRVWVYLPDGRLLCEAEANGNSKHYMPIPKIEQARQTRARGRLARVDTKREEILAELNGSPALPAPSAAQIVIGGRIVEPEKVLAQRKAVIADEEVTPIPAGMRRIEPAKPAKSRSERSAAENYADWLELDSSINSGEEVSEADARWHRTYQNSAQFKAQAKKTTSRAATRVA
ncbi:MAG: Mu transposase C-terminal domain-containing protein [Aromatoleum sp.]|jgi:putative transposase|uniref:Mu transposase C-terminal domain-containing protein n=1 Tax=Aromatoleum sp. TaxID=2307007 RepID=UPI002895CD59|nr:Mu transposase C-terminal domain-containing protein [Aromatoleum sp.]MDT3668972.1 Mu transposase C-terminal domain-containing protein [Aromatoleum sp.]